LVGLRLAGLRGSLDEDGRAADPSLHLGLPICTGRSCIATGVDRKDWHRYFYLVTGLTGATTLAVFLFLPEPSGEAGSHLSEPEGRHEPLQGWKERLRVLKNIDWIGALLSITGLVLLFYVLAVAPGAKKGWDTPCESSIAARSPLDLVRRVKNRLIR
jgi:hypothetical protein